MPTTRTRRTPITGTTRTGRTVPTKNIAILQGRDSTGTVVNIRQNNDGGYIYVFHDDGTPISRPRWVKRVADVVTNRTKRTPI